MKTVVIFGGSGFVGSHIIRRIAKNGHKIIIPHHTPLNEAKLRLLGTTGQVIPIKFKNLHDKKILDIISKADVIINLKTLWDEKIISYLDGILNFNIQLVNLIKKIKHSQLFIYFSGLGIDNKVDSKRSNAIFQSEQYIEKSSINSFIIRPGIIIGGGDKFLKGLLPIFKMSFFIPIFGKGLKKFQPVYIDDVSIAITKIIESNTNGHHLYDFVGPEIYTYRELYNFISACMNKTRVILPIPFVLAKIGISIIEKTPFSPLNSEQLRLFENDNISSNTNKQLEDLDVHPQDLKEIIKKFIKKNI